MAQKVTEWALLLGLSGCFAEAGWRTREPSPGVENPWRDLLLSPAACRAPYPERLSEADVRADFAVLERILRHGYAAFGYLRRERGVDWDARLASIREDIGTLGDGKSPAEVADWLVSRFSFVEDRHFRLRAEEADGDLRGGTPWPTIKAWTGDIVLERRDSGWVVAPGPHASGAELDRCDGIRLDQAVRPTFVDGRVRFLLVVPAPERPPPLHCSLRDGGSLTIPLRRLAVSEREPAGSVMELRRGRVPYLRVSSLSDTSAGELAALADTPDVLREAPAFVLDLRGNSGGVDRFARAWFGRMSAGGLRYGRVQRLESDVVIQGELNSNVCNGSEEGLDATSREYLEERARVHRERLRELEAHFGGSAERWHLSRPRWGGHAATTYDGWIVVLLNKGCASACENFVTFLEQMPHVLFLGENTAGTGVPGDAETYRLPHSRIWVWAATKLFFNPPGVPGFPEGRGYLPDVWLDTASADGIAARVAECLSDERCGRRLLGEIRR